jgi:hypothetical protein
MPLRRQTLHPAGQRRRGAAARAGQAGVDRLIRLRQWNQRPSPPHTSQLFSPGGGAGHGSELFRKKISCSRCAASDYGQRHARVKQRPYGGIASRLAGQPVVAAGTSGTHVRELLMFRHTCSLMPSPRSPMRCMRASCRSSSAARTAR